LDLDDGSVESDAVPDDDGDGDQDVAQSDSGFGLANSTAKSQDDVVQALVHSQAMRKAQAQNTQKLAAQAKNQANSPENQTLQHIYSDNQAMASRLAGLEGKVQDRDALFTNNNRDSVRTDAKADAEFAQAMASRHASSIARRQGLALIPALRTIEMRLQTYASSEQGGKFIGVVTEDVWDATFASIGIPRGTLSRGYIESTANDGDSRIRMTVTEFILPSGDSVQLRVPDAVTDPIGATGVKANINHQYGTRIGFAAGYGLLAAVTASGTATSSNTNATFNDTLRTNVAGQVGQMGQQSMQTGMGIKPIAELREGSDISMILGSNLYLVPWERLRPVIPAPNQNSAH
jgi:type IV secretory pathway VirB10-like protein